MVRFGVIAVATAVGLAACGGDMSPRGDRATGPLTEEEREDERMGRLFGDAFTFGTGQQASRDRGAPTIGVNSSLWQATLDTVAFMPIDEADPFGGVVITDWYSPSESPDERFRVNVYILDSQLRSDGVRVGTFRQVRQNGQWVDAPASESTARRLEEAILARALDIRAGGA